jgi:hypothetical protein
MPAAYSIPNAKTIREEDVLTLTKWRQFLTWVLVAGFVALATIGLGGFRWRTVRDARLIPAVIATGIEAIAVLASTIDLSRV